MVSSRDMTLKGQVGDQAFCHRTHDLREAWQSLSTPVSTPIVYRRFSSPLLLPFVTAVPLTKLLVSYAWLLRGSRAVTAFALSKCYVNPTTSSLLRSDKLSRTLRWARPPHVSILLPFSICSMSYAEEDTCRPAPFAA